jgi:hypothetical protein
LLDSKCKTAFKVKKNDRKQAINGGVGEVKVKCLNRVANEWLNAQTLEPDIMYFLVM